MNKVLFWDFDGTLVHANESYYLSLNQALLDAGYAVAEDEVRFFLKGSLSWGIWQFTYPDKTGLGWWETMYGRCMNFFSALGIPGDQHVAICRNFREKNTHFPYRVFDDAIPVLEEAIARGYRNYLISNNYPELPEVVERVGLRPYFQELFVSANVGYDKPQPEIFRRALAAAGNPDRAYMIGDNPVADIKGAAAMGLETVLVHREGEFEADHICSSLSQILEFI